MSKKPQILVSNDDGIGSEGIQALAKALSNIGKVTVVAPEREQSTMGHALTLHKPIRLYQMPKSGQFDQWAVSGTPADCVFMGIRQILKEKPDLIVSGINRGANLGNDFFYSGTVAAAREGALLGIPSIATSLMVNHSPLVKGRDHYEDAAQYTCALALELLKNSLPEGELLNVNFPNLPLSKVKGARVSKQGFRYYENKTSKRTDPRGKDYFWLGGQYSGFKDIRGSDCALVDKGYISITPCKLNVTDYELMQEVKEWIVDPKNILEKKSRKLQKSAKKTSKS